MTAAEVFAGSDAIATRRYLAELAECRLGAVAAALFRVQKASSRAKQYRGRCRGYSYDRKNEQLHELVAALQRQARLRWGWQRDPAMRFYPWVLYVDLPDGQVSFHSGDRLEGPAYPGEWDGAAGTSPDRICAFCDRVRAWPRLPDPRQMVMFWPIISVCPHHVAGFLVN